MFVKSGSV